MSLRHLLVGYALNLYTSIPYHNRITMKYVFQSMGKKECLSIFSPDDFNGVGFEMNVLMFVVWVFGYVSTR